MKTRVDPISKYDIYFDRRYCRTFWAKCFQIASTKM